MDRRQAGVSPFVPASFHGLHNLQNRLAASLAAAQDFSSRCPRNSGRADSVPAQPGNRLDPQHRLERRAARADPPGSRAKARRLPGARGLRPRKAAGPRSAPQIREVGPDPPPKASARPRRPVSPCHSWERGLNEHTKGLPRQYPPKGTDFREVTDARVREVQDILNVRPRKALGYLTPAQAPRRASGSRGPCGGARSGCPGPPGPARP